MEMFAAYTASDLLIKMNNRNNHLLDIPRQMAKLHWTQSPKGPLILQAEMLQSDINKYDMEYINEVDMRTVSDWCDEHNCGMRISFGLFQFKTESQRTMFLMKWSS
jgi:hypothetical protein